MAWSSHPVLSPRSWAAASARQNPQPHAFTLFFLLYIYILFFFFFFRRTPERSRAPHSFSLFHSFAWQSGKPREYGDTRIDKLQRDSGFVRLHFPHPFPLPIPLLKTLYKWPHHDTPNTPRAERKPGPRGLVSAPPPACRPTSESCAHV